MSAHSKDNSTVAERYVYISQLSWESRTKKTKVAPRAILEGRVLSWKGKFNNCSSGDGDDDVGGSRRQANKKIRSGNGR
jgi:hypothetical protein